MYLRNVRSQLQKTKLTGVDYVDHLTTVYSQDELSAVDHVGKAGASGQVEMIPSPLLGKNLIKDIFGGSGFLPKDAFLSDDCFVTSLSHCENYWDIA